MKIKINGKDWEANRWGNSRCAVRFHNCADENDGMMWSAPTEEIGELVWRVRCADYHPTKAEMFMLCSVIDSFHELLFKPATEQRAIARGLRGALNGQKETGNE